jgi:hypothetical protein
LTIPLAVLAILSLFNLSRKGVLEGDTSILPSGVVLRCNLSNASALDLLMKWAVRMEDIECREAL